MNNTPIRLGVLALLLLVISICLSMLSMLSIASSAADHRLAERFAESMATRYELEEQGQRYLAEVNKNPGAEELTKQFALNGYTLDVTLKRNEDRYEIEVWKIKKTWEQNTTIEGLWKGE